MPTKIVNFCNKVIELSFYSLFFLVPLILTPWNYELFEYNKMMLVYSLTIIIASMWLIKMTVNKKIIVERGPFGLVFIFFLISQVLATVFSIDVHTSIWGYYSRFHGGLLSTVSYVVLYFALINNLGNLSYLSNLIKTMLFSALLVSVYALAEHFGIDRDLWVQDVQNRVFSTLGQPNWLGAYLAILIPITMALSLNLFRVSNLGFWVLSLLFYTALLYTKSRSGLIGFWVADVIFWLIIFIVRPASWRGELLIPPSGIRRLILSFVICHLSFVIVTFFVGGSGLGVLEKYSYPKLFTITSLTETAKPTQAGQTILETGVTQSSDIRKIVWQGALDIFKNNPIVGSGVETFAYSYYQYRPVEHNMTSEWDFLYNKAHNEYLNFLATTGIVGFGTWMLFILAYIWWFLKNYNRYNLLTLGLFAGWLSILVTNFFGFSVVIVGLLFFLIPALTYLLLEEPIKTEVKTANRLSSAQISIISLIIIITLISLIQLGRFWYADTVFAKGYRENRSSQYVPAYEHLTAAIKINPQEPFYADELSFVSAVLATALDREKDATSASLLSDQAILLSNKIVLENPKNINFLKSRVRVFFALSQIDPGFKNESLKALEAAQKLAPSDPKITYNLAVLYAQGGQIARAEELFKKTIRLKPDYRDAYYSLALFYKDQKEVEKAKEQLNFIIKRLNPKDEQAKKKLEEWRE